MNRLYEENSVKDIAQAIRNRKGYEGTGKNKFDKTKCQIGQNWNGATMNYSIASSDIPVKPSTTYTLSVSNMPNYSSATIVQLDDNDNVIISHSALSFTTKENTKKIRISIRSATTYTWTKNDLTNANIQFEESNVVTSYEPYSPSYKIGDMAQEIKNLPVLSQSIGSDTLKYNAKERLLLGGEYRGNVRQETSILPTEYQQVEHIESTGTQYINTGFAITTVGQVYKAILDTQYTSTISGNVILISSDVNVWMGQASGYYAIGGAFKSNTPATERQIVEVSYGTQTTLKVNNETITRTANSAVGNVTLFGSGSYLSKAKLYSCKIYNYANILVRDFIPCYRKSDNVVGLYDLVSNTFFTNIGTGAFLKGANVILPNPDYEQDVEIMKGYNLFDYKEIPNWEEWQYGIASLKKVFKLEPNTQYTLSSNVPLGSSTLLYFNGTDTATKGVYLGKTVTQTTDDNGNLYVGTFKNREYYEDIVSGKYYIQLTKGTTEKPLLSYNSIGVKRVGKNLFNGVSSQTGNFLFNNGIYGAQSNFNVSEYINIKPNTTYTYTADLQDKGTLGGVAAICYYNEDKSLISGTQYNSVKVFTFTTPNNTAYIRFSYRNDVDKHQIEEGSVATEYEPYQERIDYIKLEQENLIDISKSKVNIKVNTSGEVTDTISNVTDFIELKDGTYFVKNIFGTGTMTAIYFYDINKQYVSHISDSRTALTIEKPSNAKYVRFNYPKENVPILVKGNGIYDGSGLLPADKIEIRDDNHIWLVKNYAKLLFDGSETWNLITSGEVPYYRYRYVENVSANISTENAYSNMFIKNNNVSTTGASLGFALWSTGELRVREQNMRESSTEWKEFLATNNMELWYPLAEPIEIDLGENPIKTIEGMNNVEILATMNPTNMKEEYIKE